MRRLTAMAADLFSGALVCAILVSGIAALAAQLVVVEAKGTALQPGQVIDAAAPLDVAAGGHLSLVGEDGKISKIDGPYKGPLLAGSAAAGDPGLVQAISRLFADNQPNATTWGTFRGYETANTFRGEAASDPRPEQLWAVNVRRSESACIPADGKPVLWRPDAGQELAILVLHLSTGKEATVEFAADEQSAAWPNGVPLLDGGEYAIRDAADSWERRLQLRIIPASQTTAMLRAAWMSDAGCFRQARELIAQAL